MSQEQARVAFTSSVSANTDIDVSQELRGVMDVRASNDPIADAKLIDRDANAGAGGATDLTSQGQQDGSLSAGNIEVIDDQTVQLGDAVVSGDILVITYEARNQGRLVN